MKRSFYSLFLPIAAFLLSSKIIFGASSTTLTEETNSIRVQKYNELIDLTNQLKESKLSLEEVDDYGSVQVEYMSNKGEKFDDTGFLDRELWSTCLTLKKRLLTTMQDTIELESKILDFSAFILQKTDEEIDKEVVDIIDKFKEISKTMIDTNQSLADLSKETFEHTEKSINYDKSFSIYFAILEKLETDITPTVDKLAQALKDKNEVLSKELKNQAYDLITEANNKIEVNRSTIEKAIPNVELLDAEKILDEFLNPEKYQDA